MYKCKEIKVQNNINVNTLIQQNVKQDRCINV